MGGYTLTIRALLGALTLADSVLERRVLSLLPALAEARARHWTKGAHGYFTGSYSDGAGGAGSGSAGGKGLDKSGGCGIIKVGSEAMFRKKNSGKVEPMPQKQFRKIERAFRKQGGVIQTGEETDRYLESKHAEGITYDSKTILLRQKPGRASVFEELIHTAQYRDGKNDGSRKCVLLCEIEAQEKLIKNAKAYRLTAAEIEQTQKALKAYTKELNDYLVKHGGG